MFYQGLMLFGDEWVSEIFVSWGMTLQTLGMFLHTQTESVLIKTAWTGWNTLFHACMCVCGGECFCSDLKIHINSEENKNSSLVNLDLTGQIQLTSTQSNPHMSALNTRLADGCMWRKSWNFGAHVSFQLRRFEFFPLMDLLSMILFILLT